MPVETLSQPYRYAVLCGTARVPLRTRVRPHTHVNDGASWRAASTRWAGAFLLPPFAPAQIPVWEARQHRATAAGLFPVRPLQGI